MTTTAADAATATSPQATTAPSTAASSPPISVVTPASASAARPYERSPKPATASRMAGSASGAPFWAASPPKKPQSANRGNVRMPAKASPRLERWRSRPRSKPSSSETKAPPRGVWNQSMEPMLTD